MNLMATIFEWINTRPLWIQDAARRLYLAASHLSEHDYAELYSLFCNENGLLDSSGVVPHPIDPNLIPDQNVGHTLTLKALHDLKHVNAIDCNQVLTFGKGLTVVFGVNGSGKSGYARVFKRACFSRDQGEVILPNVNRLEEENTVPEATFDVEVDGVPKSLVWKQTDDGHPKELSMISVFDTKSARVVLQKEQECHYVPYGLDIVQSLGAEVLPHIKKMAEVDLSRQEVSTESFKELLGDHPVGSCLALATAMDFDELERLSNLNEKEVARGIELRRLLEEVNLDAKAKESKLAAMRIKAYVEKVDRAETVFSAKKIERLVSLAKIYGTAISEEKDSARIIQEEGVTLCETGGGVWKQLFEAARRYSVECAYAGEGFPNVKPGAKCVLCQQVLDGQAQARMKKFNEYITSEFSEKVKKAKQDLDKCADEIAAFKCEDNHDDPLETEVEGYHAGLKDKCQLYFHSVGVLKTSILNALGSKMEWEDLPCLAESPRQILRDLAAQKLHESRRFRDSMDAERFDKMKKEYAALRARLLLGRKYMPAVTKWYAACKRSESLKKAIATLNTGLYTKKAAELAESTLTAPLREALEREVHALGLRNFGVETFYNAHGTGGKVKGGFVLKTPIVKPICNVLSEGQLKGLALVSFFAETDVAGHTHAMVFDDPITSFDTFMLIRVAQRIAEESLKRQVVVFSHNIVFVNSLKRCCEKIGAGIITFSLSWSATGSGRLVQGLSWDNKGYGERITKLRSVAKDLKQRWLPVPDEGMVEEMRLAYDKVRATIERAIEEVCFKGVIRRFEDYVQASRLKLVVPLDRSAAETLASLWHEASVFVEGHDHAGSSIASCPTPDDLSTLIGRLENAVKAIEIARKKPGAEMRADPIGGKC